MANYNSTLATAMGATPTKGGPAEWQLPGVIQSSVKIYRDYYVTTGAEANSTIRFFTDGINNVLPDGANILKMDFYVNASEAGITVSVGDLNCATRYLSASTTFNGTSPAVNATIVVPGLVSGVPYIIGTNPSNATLGNITNGDNQIILTVNGTTMTANISVCGILYYTLTE
jgi:hypothetical protein